MQYCQGWVAKGVLFQVGPIRLIRSHARIEQAF